MSETPPKRVTLSFSIVRWAAELVLVFIGVYAAFWLNSYQQHQQDAKRRDQILASLEEDVQRKMTELKNEEVNLVKEAAEFEQRLKAGEKPALEPLDWTSGYSASDTATLLQAGGFDLLDVKTLVALRNAERLTRRVLSRMQHYQTWSDAFVAPNLGQNIDFFYDPATKQLRKQFAWYPEVQRGGAGAVRDMAAAYGVLLNHIRAERQRK